ncbi:MAG: hypothetical protein FWF00_01280 [Endomicrobia bacterium]|nr:hypothetical protein [Endomicrobiia bacterium]MCL2506307.1 hypothetical protein [Endomicrobiia bacterium]
MFKKTIALIFALTIVLGNVSFAAVEIRSMNFSAKDNVAVSFNSNVLFVQDYGKILSNICDSLQNALPMAVLSADSFKFMFFDKSNAEHFIIGGVTKFFIKFSAFFVSPENIYIGSIVLQQALFMLFMIISFMLSYLGLLRLFSAASKINFSKIKYNVKNPGFAY